MTTQHIPKCIVDLLCLVRVSINLCLFVNASQLIRASINSFFFIFINQFYFIFKVELWIRTDEWKVESHFHTVLLLSSDNLARHLPPICTASEVLDRPRRRRRAARHRSRRRSRPSFLPVRQPGAKCRDRRPTGEGNTNARCAHR